MRGVGLVLEAIREGRYFLVDGLLIVVGLDLDKTLFMAVSTPLLLLILDA